MTDSPRQYPVVCQKCQTEKGFPYLVRTLTERPGFIEIKIRCRDCGHEWAEVVTSSE